MTGPILIPIAVGELVDKITILEIKAARVADPPKRANVLTELRLLCDIRDRHLPPVPALRELADRLKAVNETLWQIEDDLRACEGRRDFGPRFVELARAVYRQNDRRFQLKREIDALTGSPIVEEKSYQAY